MIVHFDPYFKYRKGDLVFDGKSYFYVVDIEWHEKVLSVNFKRVSSNWLIRKVQVLILNNKK